MSQNFNINELMIISKYLTTPDYHTFFKLFPNLSIYYHSTFNYLNFNICDINYVRIKQKYKILNLFPNVETINININFDESEEYSYTTLHSIIKIYNTFLKLYPNKFIKINVTNKYLFIKFDITIVKYLNKINELIKNNIINNDFKIYIEDYYYEQYYNIFKNYEFIINVNFVCSYEQINFSNLKHNQVFNIQNTFIYKTKEFSNKNNVNEIYFHRYRNTIFKA